MPSIALSVLCARIRRSLAQPWRMDSCGPLFWAVRCDLIECAPAHALPIDGQSFSATLGEAMRDALKSQVKSIAWLFVLADRDAEAIPL